LTRWTRADLRLGCAAVLLLLCAPLATANFTGPVVSVLDRDTIEVSHDQHPELIRLSGIDCPEKGQAYGHKAKQAASALVFGKDVLLQTHGQDKHRRTLADVFLLDGTHVNYTLVKDGWCWWYRKYASGNTVLEGLEKEAREGKKGLWSDPRQYRRGSGGSEPGRASGKSLCSTTVLGPQLKSRASPVCIHCSITSFMVESG
jgi:endonuclease YncB( thermonuclease family)